MIASLVLAWASLRDHSLAAGNGVARWVVGLFRWMLGYEGVPYLSRSTFRHELISSVFASAGAGMVLPEFTQLFFFFCLHAPDEIMAVLVAEAAAGNFLSAFLAQHIQRRRRIPFVVVARLAIAAVMLVVALLPVGRASVLPFALLLLLPAVLGAVALNAQSGIWHSNYPSHSRGRIFSRLLALRLATTAAAVKLAGYALDAWPTTGHRLIYPLAALAMVLSAWTFSRIRVRREQSLLRQGLTERLHLLAGFRVLWHDRQYGRYMLWQMISGGSLMMIHPIIVPAMKNVFQINYSSGTTSLVLIPFAMEVASAPLAGWLFDHLSIMRFRALNAATWAVSRLVVYAALFTGCWPLVFAGFAVQGLAACAGGVVWNIGHTRFAPPGRSQLYMGIHLTLQGLRGLTLPFLGVWLYKTVGLHVMVAAVALQLVAAMEFLISPAPKPASQPGADDGPSTKTR